MVYFSRVVLEDGTSIDKKLAQVNFQLVHKLQDFSAQDLNGVSPPLIAPCIECRAGFRSIAVLRPSLIHST